MIKKLPVVTILLILIALTPIAYAQNLTNGTTRISTDAATKLKDQRKLLQEQKGAAIAQARAKFEAGLKEMKDQKKKAIVEKIDAKIAEINAKQTTRYQQVLDKLQMILDKEAKTASGTAMLEKIENAQTAIDDAKTAVVSQAAKIYTIAIGTDETIKLNVGTIVSQFRQDLQAVYKKVMNAKIAEQPIRMMIDIKEKRATGAALISIP
jgi:hypothetical protein